VIGRGIGSVVETRGAMLIAKLPLARVGAGVRICARDGHRLGGEIVGLGRFGVTIAPFGDLRGVARGDPVALEPRELDVVLGYAALGRAIDPRAEREGGLLVWYGYVRAAKAGGLQAADGFGEVLRRDRKGHVGAVDAVLSQPEIMQNG